LCSRGGTFVNDQPVREAVIKLGDRVRVGTIELTLTDPAAGNGEWTSQPAAPDGTAVSPCGSRAAWLAAGAPPELGYPAGSGPDETPEVNPGPLAACVGGGPPVVGLTLVVGRRSACDVVIGSPDVSPVHALIFGQGGRAALFDLGSRSGTFVNGSGIQLAWLAEGDRVGVGDETIAISRAVS
jgi:pSer/pThr/pTyr-binding forkhead associated (FHA) protein